jgi:hypothetical protein
LRHGNNSFFYNANSRVKCMKFDLISQEINTYFL